MIANRRNHSVVLVAEVGIEQCSVSQCAIGAICECVRQVWNSRTGCYDVSPRPVLTLSGTTELEGECARVNLRFENTFTSPPRPDHLRASVDRPTHFLGITRRQQRLREYKSDATSVTVDELTRQRQELRRRIRIWTTPTATRPTASRECRHLREKRRVSDYKVKLLVAPEAFESILAMDLSMAQYARRGVSGVRVNIHTCQLTRAAEFHDPPFGGNKEPSISARRVQDPKTTGPGHPAPDEIWRDDVIDDRRDEIGWGIPGSEPLTRSRPGHVVSLRQGSLPTLESPILHLCQPKPVCHR